MREFVDIETAKKPGRQGFDEMVRFLKRSSSVRVLLVEKTDRLYRNLKDYVTMDELDLEIHFVKESVVLSKDSRSSEKFMHGIKVLMAKNYIDNLSEETRKGMLEKAEQSIYPSFAPLGYRNVMGPNGKRIIEPDPDIAPIITKIFDWYAAGQCSIADGKLSEQCADEHRIQNSGYIASTANHRGAQSAQSQEPFRRAVAGGVPGVWIVFHSPRQTEC